MCKVSMRKSHTQRNNSNVVHPSRHLFFTLQWNTMCRSNNIADLNLNHIDWFGDYLTVTLMKQKNDTKGDSVYPRAIFANVTNWVLCPITSLAIYLVTLSTKPPNERLFMEGTEETFTKWITEFKKSMTEEDEIAVGISKQKFGLHGIRKGVISFLCSVSGGPSVTSTFLRSNHNIGGSQNLYLFHTDGGDAFCGRVATAISLTDRNFASLPPHFEKNILSGLMSQEDWGTIFPFYTQYPIGLKKACPFLLASLVYHSSKFKNPIRRQISCPTDSTFYLSDDHPLFSSLYWCHDYKTRLLPHLQTGVNYNEVTNMTASGVPPSYILHMQTEDRINKFEANMNERMDNLTNLLMAHVSVASDSAVQIEIREMKQQFQEQTCLLNRILDKFDSNSSCTLNVNSSNMLTQSIPILNEENSTEENSLDVGSISQDGYRRFKIADPKNPGKTIERSTVPHGFVLPR